MRAGADLRAQVRRWLQWLRRGDLSVALLRPRRASLPAVMAVGFVALVALHEPGGTSGACSGMASCVDQLQWTADREPAELATAAGWHVAAAGAVYFVGTAVTAIVGRRVDLASVAPWLFAPDDATLRAVLVVGAAALVTYVAGAYYLAYTIVGFAALYLLYFPVLAAVAVADGHGPPPDPLAAPAAVFLVVVVPLVEVCWLYALAHGLASGLPGDEDAEGTAEGSAPQVHH